MKTQLSVLAIATAAALFAAPAFAQSLSGDDASTSVTTTLVNDITVKGKVTVGGDIDVNGESAATVDQDQIVGGNRSSGDGDHTARVNGNALRGADGNIGLNVSAGVGNAQSNDAAISTLSGSASDCSGGKCDDKGKAKPSGAMATAMVFSTQATGLNEASSYEWGTNYEAELKGDALRGVVGNVGVNVAAGVGNGQSNGMAAGLATGALIAKAGSDSEQVTMLNGLDSDCGDLDLVAHLGGNALQNASGNIGVNVASGVGNLQHNGLAITSGCATCK